MNKAVYLDYASTTPVAQEVVDHMNKFLAYSGMFANPTSQEHGFGKAASLAVEDGRTSIARLLNCRESEIVFTSGATESNNLAIKGTSLLSEEPAHVVTVATEHKAVLDTCLWLKKFGVETTIVKTDTLGRLDLRQLRKAIKPNTAIVSVMHVNNETGVVHNIKAIADMLADYPCLFHIDAAQSVGKIPLDLKQIPVDLVSISAHKMYGPKGVGALFIRRTCTDRLMPIITGGGQENGLRSGTLATHQIAGLGAAAKLRMNKMSQDQDRIGKLSSFFLEKIGEMDDVLVNGDRDNSIPNILNISFLGVDAESLVNRLHTIAVSTSSACTSGALEPSYVLRAMGHEGDRLYGAVRFSFGRHTNKEELQYVLDRIAEEVSEIRQLQSRAEAK